MKTLAEMWLRAEWQSPRVEAVVDARVRRTYAQTLARARRLASALRARGLRKGDRVAMLSMNRAEWFDYYAACNTAGFIANTVNFRLAPPEIEWILRDSGAVALIYEAQYAATVAEIAPRLDDLALRIRIGEGAEEAGDPDFEAILAEGDPGADLPAPAPEDPAHLIYTSGTTGRPKGVIRTQAQDAANAGELALFMDMAHGGSTLLIMPMFHVGAQLEAHGQIYRQGTVVLHSAFDPAEALRTIERERIQCTHMAPTMVQQVLETPEIRTCDLSSLRTLCYAAAPMPVSVLRRALDLLGPVLVDCYGSTEVASATALHKTSHRPAGDAQDVERLGSVGQALPHVELRVLDDALAPLPARAVGEVAVRGPSVLAGYWNNSRATMESLREGWFLTGDMGWMDEQGYLHLVDRKKDMIISGGENIYCREVEEAIMAHAEVADVAVIGVPDERWGEAVKAIVTPRAGCAPTAETIIAHCRSLIAGYKRPKSVEFLAELPRLPSGKVNKVALRARFREPAAAEQASV